MARSGLFYPALGRRRSPVEERRVACWALSAPGRPLPPKVLFDTYVAAGGKPVVATLDALWQQLGPQTIGVMTDGAQVLAKIWAGAWQNHAIAQQDLVSIAPDALRAKYEDVTFVPSLYLDDPALPPLL